MIKYVGTKLTVEELKELLNEGYAAITETGYAISENLISTDDKWIENLINESEENMKTLTVENNMVYSESLGEMIIKGFYMKKEKNGEYRHYTWNDKDCVYWADDVDDRFYYEVPQNAILTLK